MSDIIEQIKTAILKNTVGRRTPSAILIPNKRLMELMDSIDLLSRFVDEFEPCQHILMWGVPVIPSEVDEITPEMTR